MIRIDGRLPLTLTAMALAVTADLYVRAQSSPAAAAPPQTAGTNAEARVTGLKTQAAAGVEELHEYTQQMVDSVFSFGELGFQEVETSKYLTGILEKKASRSSAGIAGIPTAWMATWGSGKPVIALGSDIDGIPQASQKPGVAYHDPLIEGAPGHGEGHNSGMPLNITAAIAVKKMMEREKLPGTIKLWPGVAEELSAQGVLRARRATSRTSTSSCSRTSASNFGVELGRQHRQRPGVGRVHVQGRERARGRRAVARTQRARCRRADGHRLELSARASAAAAALALRDHQRRRSAERRAADATVWYYFRETDYAHIKEMWEIGDTMAQAAALMTDTTRDLAHPGVGLAAALQQDRRRNDVREHPEGRTAEVDRGGPDAREGAAEGAWGSRARVCRPSSQPLSGRAVDARR